MLTSHDEEMDEAMCLAAGADDYITKPVSARILALRTTTQIRHRAAQNIVTGSKIVAGPLSLDTDTRELTINHVKIELTRTEYDFLFLLIGNPKRVFTREQISEAIGVSLEFSSDHLLDTHASRIRGKIREVSEIKVLHAVRGVGYRLLSN
jgi:DNA-binding response OmpR family regulator